MLTPGEAGVGAAACKEEYLRFDLEQAELLILRTSDARHATREALKDHCIPSDRSADLEGSNKTDFKFASKLEDNGAAVSSFPD